MMSIILIIIYTMLCFAITIFWGKKSKSAVELSVADRNIGVFPMACSIGATWCAAPALFSSAERAYISGIVGLLWFVVPNILCLIIFIPFGNIILNKMPNGITLSSYMYHTYGKKARNIYLFNLISISVMNSAVQILAGGKIVSLLTGIPFFVTTLFIAGIIFSYSQFSGIRADIRTDTMQMCIIIIVCLIFVPWAIYLCGKDAIIKGLFGNDSIYPFSNNSLSLAFSFGIPTSIGLLSGAIGDQVYWQRAFSMKKQNIKKTFLIGSVLFAIVPLSMGLLGFISLGSGFIPNDKSLVNMELITSLFPEWIIIPFTFMLLSGLLSTVDSNICATASLSTDFVKNDNIIISKIAMALSLIISLIISNIPGVTIWGIWMFYATLRASTVLPTIMSLKGVKLTENGIFFGVLSSITNVTFVFQFSAVSLICLKRNNDHQLTVMLSYVKGKVTLTLCLP